MWDAIVIGSGIGGLAAASALAKRGRKVLVLEQHTVAGGLTQTFRRQDWMFAPGVHYIGGVGPQAGPDGQFGRLLAWLTDDALRFTPCANPYDIVHLPGFEFGISHPEQAYREALLARFPQQSDAIARWFESCEAARRSAFALFASHGMPHWMSWALNLWRGAGAEHWARRTLADELMTISDPALRAVLGGRWADYGSPPAQAPFAMHALVTGSYNGGAYYPVGGPARFAETLVPVIEAAGGELRVGCGVRRITIENDRANGVEYEQNGKRRSAQARHLISAMGVSNTVDCLDPGVAAAVAANHPRPGAGVVLHLLVRGLGRRPDGRRREQRQPLVLRDRRHRWIVAPARRGGRAIDLRFVPIAEGSLRARQTDGRGSGNGRFERLRTLDRTDW
jgi:all-trans-retinol 13,14-reductase